MIDYYGILPPSGKGTLVYRDGVLESMGNRTIRLLGENARPLKCTVFPYENTTRTTGTGFLSGLHIPWSGCTGKIMHGVNVKLQWKREISYMKYNRHDL